RLVGVHLRGAAARVILNYNPHYTSSITMNNATMSHLEDHNVSATYVYANGSHGMNIHTKGVIVDGNRTLVSSINWNHHAVHRNREVGIIIENQQVAEYFARVFSHDWNLTATEPREIMVGREAVKALVVAAAYVFAGLALYRHWRT
ncbi:MAG: phospholipase D-like domain-containing protein, partial [Candidatus Thermoplasmatota archaeon]|nr:phospholipase D-like domain-containing protein [Candidatus Thermoplasmatota archaeon]